MTEMMFLDEESKWHPPRFMEFLIAEMSRISAFPVKVVRRELAMDSVAMAAVDSSRGNVM